VLVSRTSARPIGSRDKDKARRLLKEAGYAGQPLRWVTTREYEFTYENALVAKQQLEEVRSGQRRARGLRHA
jgi:ABC-type transport system substrate-binding protein